LPAKNPFSRRRHDDVLVPVATKTMLKVAVPATAKQ